MKTRLVLLLLSKPLSVISAIVLFVVCVNDSTRARPAQADQGFRATAVSPNGKWIFTQVGLFDRNSLMETDPTPTPKKIFFAAGFSEAPWVKYGWSADSKKLLLINEQSASCEMMVLHIDSGQRANLHLPGGCSNAVISPDGKTVAASYVSTSNPKSTLMIWNINDRQKTAWRSISFDHGVDTISWIGDHQLIVNTLSIYGQKAALRESFLVNYDGKVIRQLSPAAGDHLAGNMAPYRDASGCLLVIRGIGNDTEALFHVNPITGEEKRIAVLASTEADLGWNLLWGGPSQILIWRYSWKSFQPNTLMTRDIDCVHDTIGPIVFWRATGGTPGTDLTGRVACWNGDTSGFLQKLKSN